jgi:serine/threonine protein kinase
MTSPQLSKRENYKILGSLGKGSFGAVRKIETNDDKKIYAIKEINLPGKSLSDEALKGCEEARKEYLILRKGLSQVVKSFGSFYDENSNCFIFSMDFYPHNLEEYIQAHIKGKNMNILFTDFLTIFKDITTGKP